ncbi:hypothetical protein FAUST_6227 [Fusarium austroamericanum]|uniref:FAD-binding oxidoreductase/transferase type 4 C-terminal domain-containing protein n=1 Tax=Fusarium austroamericanum TaxID=282268 RepID=A0AAN5Z8S3_FUSAU|nr:hypothetical protein FAUST_6227 [Fusarium austroamericanum]
MSAEESKEKASHLGIFNSVMGHVGDGNFHQLEMEGTVSGEHGIELGKMHCLQKELGPATIGVMKAIKDILDPYWIVNPGKVNEANVYETSLVMGACQAFFTDEICNDLYGLLSNSDDFCSSDKQWNLINISESVATAWSCSSPGLKCLGIKPNDSWCPDTQESRNDSIDEEWEVEVEFQWLYRRFRKPNEEMDGITDENNMEHMAEAQIHHERMGCPPFMDASGIATGHKGCKPMLSGHTFTITMLEKDAHKYKITLDLRWFIISATAMSYAAWYPELLPPPLEW